MVHVDISKAVYTLLVRQAYELSDAFGGWKNSGFGSLPARIYAESSENPFISLSAGSQAPRPKRRAARLSVSISMRFGHCRLRFADEQCISGALPIHTQVNRVRRNPEFVGQVGMALLLSNAVRQKFGSLCHLPTRKQQTKHGQSGSQTTDIHFTGIIPSSR